MTILRSRSLLATLTFSFSLGMIVTSSVFGSPAAQIDVPVDTPTDSSLSSAQYPNSVYIPIVSYSPSAAPDLSSAPPDGAPVAEEPSLPPDVFPIEPTPTAQFPDIVADSEFDLPIPIDVTPVPEDGDLIQRIAGGEDAEAGQFPWQVWLKYKFVKDGKEISRFCGGILIDPLWVLTAAHCADGYGYDIVMGDLNRDSTFNERTEQSRRARRIIVYPGVADIALIELNRHITLTSFVRPIPLVSSPIHDSLVAVGSPATVSGWGKTEDLIYPTRLQHTTVSILSNESCGLNGNWELCTGHKNVVDGEEKVVGICKGDSGGPLVVKDGDDWRLAGVVRAVVRPKYAPECGSGKGYDISMRVSAFVPWINSYVHPPALRGSFQLVPRNSSRCLDIAGGPGATGNGANVQIWDCWGTAATNQLWKLVPVGSYYEIRAINSDKCLDVAGGTSAIGNGVNVQQSYCAGASQTNQLWRLRKEGNGFQIIAAHSGKCLDVAGGTGATANGTNVQQSSCTGANQTNQLWNIIPVGDFQITAQHSLKCLDVAGGTGAISTGANVQQWSCVGNSQTNQLWRPIHVGNGDYQVMAVHSGKCLDVAGGTGATGNGANVHQWPCVALNQTNQIWSLVPINKTFQLVAKHSGKCLDVAGGTAATADGTNVQQSSCTGVGQTNQLWRFR